MPCRSRRCLGLLRGFECALDDQSPAAAWTPQCKASETRIIVAFIFVTDLFPGRWFGPEQVSYPGDIGSAVAVSVEAVVADAVLAFWQDVDQEPADELPGCKRHSGVSARAIEAIVFDSKGDAVRIEPDQATVGNGDPVGVAR